jgi:hypothetical protein
VGTAISAWFSNDGSIVAEPRAAGQPVVLQPQATNPRNMMDDELRLVYAYKIIQETKAKAFAPAALVFVNLLVANCIGHWRSIFDY